MVYFIIETKNKADGDTDIVSTPKYTFASAMNYYLTRSAAYYVDTTYPSASVVLVDNNLNQIEHKDIVTSYVPAE